VVLDFSESLENKFFPKTPQCFTHGDRAWGLGVLVPEGLVQPISMEMGEARDHLSSVYTENNKE
jgi:hypothetical protein